MLIIVFAMSTSLLAQKTTTKLICYCSSSNPYEITALENLHWIAIDSTKYDKHYNQITNIDASNTSNQKNYKGIWGNQ